ncbi:hypothetical protein Csa_023832, partial [Cucumis sativus]
RFMLSFVLLYPHIINEEVRPKPQYKSHPQQKTTKD